MEGVALERDEREFGTQRTGIVLVRFSVSVGNSEAGGTWAQAHTNRMPAAVGSPAGKRGLSAGKRAL